MDFHFFVVALTRLRRAAVLASKIDVLKPRMRAALSEFDAALPHLKTMRDVAEHIDDYAVDSGRNSKISRKELEVASRNGDTWHWLGFTTNIEAAFVAAAHLFEALKSAAAEFPRTPNRVRAAGLRLPPIPHHPVCGSALGVSSSRSLPSENRSPDPP
jgi:hypothetical protein